jgi:long-chain acyl-CoA synthetase
MIVLTNGKKCFPEEVEALVNDIPGIKESVVWGENSSREAIDIVAVLHIDREKIPQEVDPSDDIKLTAWLSEEIKEVNSKMPAYKGIKYFIITENDFVKTTTLKIKRPEVIKIIHDKLQSANETMKGVHMKNIDKI